ncbi:class F sortase [Dactylosporangium sp. AC04546]|uniref:class F sortase n=1 Tax=Dactylosporangium sp. AC04546 TaxID=2862460 RepID=UPI001EDF6E5A|nr:class F sortase [Dactylosporangium sp. AC04546]WVK81901.1 class F sortase [Dactylosporangium sp. AC04546]
MSTTDGRVVRHRRYRLTPARRRAAALVLSVLALAAPVYAGTAALVGRRVELAAGDSTWIVPNRVDLPADTADGAAGEGAPPSRLRIGALGVDTALESLTMDAAGVLASPREYAEAGWFAQGTMPGDPGPAVLAGHVDSKTGPAVFYKLHELKAGDRILVLRGGAPAGAWLTFSVTAVEHYAKAHFPTQRVYGPTPVPELRLITCGGAFDAARHTYRDNIVVYAVLN